MRVRAYLYAAAAASKRARDDEGTPRGLTPIRPPTANGSPRPFGARGSARGAPAKKKKQKHRLRKRRKRIWPFAANNYRSRIYVL